MGLAIAFIFCLIFARLIYVQLVWGSELKYRATDQWNREIPIIAGRGYVYDTNGQILAGNLTTYSIFVRPNAVENAEYTATVLSGKVSEITIARQVPKESVEKLVSYDLPGVYYSRDNTRSYTYGSALCQVLGFTSNDGSGLSGIEKYYNEVLSGTDGEISYTTDIVGKETENLYRSG